MAEWIVEVDNMIPQGKVEERMYVFQLDRLNSTMCFMEAGTITKHPMDGTIHDVRPFMSGMPGRLMAGGEIDQFLQAMLDTAWRRGLRPAKFDPSAGELAAVKAHLDDMRRLAKVPDDGPQNAQAVSDEKKW